MALEFLIVDCSSKNQKLIRLSDIIESFEKSFDADRPKLAYLKALLKFEEHSQPNQRNIDQWKFDEMNIFWNQAINKIPNNITVKVKNFGNIVIRVSSYPDWGSDWDGPNYKGDIFDGFYILDECNRQIADIKFDYVSCHGIVTILCRIPEEIGSIYSNSSLDFYKTVLEFANIIWEKSSSAIKDGYNTKRIDQFVNNRLKK